MRAIELDDSKWPLVQIVFQGDQTDEDIERLSGLLEGVHERDERFLVLVRLQKGAMNFNHAKQLGKIAIRMNPHAKEFCAGVALVIHVETLRFIVSTFLLAAPTPFPFKSFVNESSAIKFLTECARDADLELPKLT